MLFRLLTPATLMLFTFGCDALKTSDSDDDDWGDEADWDGSTEEPWDGGSGSGTTSGGTDSASTNGGGTGEEESGEDGWVEDGGGTDGSSGSGSCQFGSGICIETTAEDPVAWCWAEAGTLNDGACADGYTSSCDIPADGSSGGTYADSATAYYYDVSYAEEACADIGGIFRDESASDSDVDDDHWSDGDVDADDDDWDEGDGEETDEEDGWDHDDTGSAHEDDTGSDDTDTGASEDTGADHSDTGTVGDTGADEADTEWIDGYCRGSSLYSRTGTVFEGYTTWEYADDFGGGCDYGGGRDVAFKWNPPYTSNWRIDIPYSEFDPVLRIVQIYDVWDEEWDGECYGEMACDRGYSWDGGSSQITEYMYSAYDYYIVIDGYDSSDYGLFRLRIVDYGGDTDAATDEEPDDALGGDTDDATGGDTTDPTDADTDSTDSDSSDTEAKCWWSGDCITLAEPYMCSMFGGTWYASGCGHLE